MNLRILFLTQYYPPESGAPQQRISGLCRQLRILGVECIVFTCYPHYPKMKLYEGYDNKGWMRETLEGIKIIRVPVYIPSDKSFFNRFLNYMSFVVNVIRYAGALSPNTFDYIFCESPPLFSGLAAVYLKKKYQARLIFNVSDLWPESIVRLGITKNFMVLWSLWKMESWIYKQSFLITGQTRGICDNIKQRFPDKEVYWLPNGVDPEKWNPEKTDKFMSRKKFHLENGGFIVGYAGVIGLAQGLHTLLECAKILKNENILFVLAGDGPLLENLKELKKTHSLDNVIFTGHFAPSMMPEFLAALDVAVVPLRKNELFLGAVPSKLFECMAMKIPVLLSVDGEARDIFEKQAHAVVYAEPENANAWAEKIIYMRSHPEEMRQNAEAGYAFVLKNFNRSAIAGKFYEKLRLWVN